VNTRRYPQDTGERIIAGVFEDGFIDGWGPLIHDAPSYRIMNFSKATCRLKSIKAEQNVVFQIQLFAHIEHPPLPVLRISFGSETWQWEIEPGWQVLCRRVPSSDGYQDVELLVINATDDPWFELHMTEISVFKPGDPRIKSRDTEST